MIQLAIYEMSLLNAIGPINELSQMAGTAHLAQLSN